MAYPKSPKGEGPDGVAPKDAGVPPRTPPVVIPKATGGAPKLPDTPMVRPPTFAQYKPPYARERYPGVHPTLDSTNVPRPRFDLKSVKEQSPEFVGGLKERLLKLYQNTPAEERQQFGAFWEGVRANPEGAATAMAARLMENMSPFANDNAPRMDEALRARTSTNSVYRWLKYTEEHQG